MFFDNQTKRKNMYSKFLITHLPQSFSCENFGNGNMLTFIVVAALCVDCYKRPPQNSDSWGSIPLSVITECNLALTSLISSDLCIIIPCEYVCPEGRNFTPFKLQLSCLRLLHGGSSAITISGTQATLACKGVQDPKL